MKKLILVLILLTIPAMAFAQTDYELTFSWEQPASGLPYLSHWNLYMYGDGIEKQVAQIPYAEGEGPFQAAHALSIDAEPGSSTERLFVLTAVAKDDQESEPSNEVSHTFVIPYPAPVSPENLSIEAIVRVRAQ